MIFQFPAILTTKDVYTRQYQCQDGYIGISRVKQSQGNVKLFWTTFAIADKISIQFGKIEAWLINNCLEVHDDIISQIKKTGLKVFD